MTTNKAVQTDLHQRHSRSKLLQKLQTCISAVSQYRLALFNQYIQPDESSSSKDLIDVRKRILDRFQWTVNELEEVAQNLQAHRISETDAQEMMDRPLIKEAIEMSLNADLSSAESRKQLAAKMEQWRMYRRDLQETKEDLFILDLFVHRGISKIDRLVDFTNLHT